MTRVYARGLTVAQREALPDDGNRYELIDGTVYVNAVATRQHQRVVRALLLLLVPVGPRDFEVLPGPVDFEGGPATVLQPDLVVVRRDRSAGDRRDVAPLLVVEVASPSTRAYDRVKKLDAYDRGGVPAYWIVDPDEPSLLVFERRDGRLAERARVVGDEAFHAEVPFAVTVVPSGLAVPQEGCGSPRRSTGGRRHDDRRGGQE